MNLRHFLVAHIGTMHTVVLTVPMCADSNIKDKIFDKLDEGILDQPENHTLLLMDWQKEPSIDLYYQIRRSLKFFNPSWHVFTGTKAVDNTQIAPIPFWSEIINDKGRMGTITTVC